LRFIIDLILDFLLQLYDLIKKFFLLLVDKFLDLHIFDKIIVINTIVAFFAIALPAGKYFIFETWFYINNPLAVYLIGIVAFMFLSMYYKHKFFFFTKTFLNLYYIAWVFYIMFSHSLSKAPYVLTKGYYLNIIAPLIFIGASVAGFFLYENE